MQYRQFGKLDWKTSVLGFGNMRLPVLEDDGGKIDEEKAIPMVRRAIDGGVNYVDTAYGYHRGQSEVFTGKVLKDGYREKVHVATKLPIWLVNSLEDADRIFAEQLQRLQIDQLDLLLFHALDKASWKKVQDLGLLNWAEKQKAAGRFVSLGFSFHDEYDVFQSIIDGYDQWEFTQIQYNYMDVDNQAGTKGLKYAASKGLAVVVMEPLFGGRLAQNPPPTAVKALFDDANPQRSPADWALQWLWNQPEVTLVLSGMSTMQQVEENLISAEKAAINSFSASELAFIDQVRETYKKVSPIPCTDCKYCQPCPYDVHIPNIFSLYNEGVMYDNMGAPAFSYTHFMKEENRADKCTECGTCESLCPQQIEIIDWLKKADAALLGKSPA